LCSRTDRFASFVSARTVCEVLIGERVLSALLTPSNESAANSNASIMRCAVPVFEFLANARKLEAAHRSALLSAIERVASNSDVRYEAARESELLALLRVLNPHFSAAHFSAELSAPRTVSLFVGLWRSELGHAETAHALTELFVFMSDEALLQSEHIAALWTATATSAHRERLALFEKMMPFLDFEQMRALTDKIIAIDDAAVCEGHCAVLSQAIEVTGDVALIERVLAFLWRLCANGDLHSDVRARAANDLSSLLRRRDLWDAMKTLREQFADKQRSAEAMILELKGKEAEK